MKISRRDAVKLIAGSVPAYYLSNAFSLAAAGTQDSASKISLTLGTAETKAVPVNYLGFSCETAQLADPSFFDPENKELVSLYKTLTPEGILRLGGNSSEFCWWKTSTNDQPPELPESARRDDNWMPHEFNAIEPIAVDNLAGFLEATGWEVIYNLNLGTGTPERDAEEAAYVAKKLGKKLLYFQIGNEPEYYRDSNNRLRTQDWNFDKYLAQWLTFARAVIARVPDAKFGGPDVGSSGQWVMRFAREASQELPGRIVACTGHYYVMGPPDDPRSTVQRLLAPDRRVDRDVPRVISVAKEYNLDYRMTEGNSCYRGGKPGVSNAFCSALWGADYLLKLASFGCAGVNLHGGGASVIRSALGGHLPGENLTPDAAAIAAEGSFYTPIAGSRENGFSARPIFYGMKLAGVLAGGRMRPVSFDNSPTSASAWVAEMPNGNTRMVLINKDANQKLQISIPSAHGAKVWRLQASGLTATSGVTLAGTEIKPGKEWQPSNEENLVSKDNHIQIDLEPASGAALFFNGNL
ncbi:MAG: glycosyl hydrolase family 79 C-terminal domain-containing protein [Sedimentisphaerales bacterium]